MTKGGPENHAATIKQFAIGLLIWEIIVIVLFGVFVRIQNNTNASLNPDRYPAYQDVNVMMLFPTLSS
jgi:cell division septal protein FtsQ